MPSKKEDWARQQRDRVKRRKAQIESGELKYEDIPHGTNGYTNYKCRCEVCKAAASAAAREDRLERQRRAREDPSTVPHGTENGYTNYRCRCGLCTWAHTEAKGSRKRYIAACKEEGIDPTYLCRECGRTLLIPFDGNLVPRHLTPEGDVCSGSYALPVAA